MSSNERLVAILEAVPGPICKMIRFAVSGPASEGTACACEIVVLEHELTETDLSVRETALARLRRIHAETGIFGIAVRGLMRVGLATSSGLKRASLFLIRSSPPGMLTPRVKRLRLARNSELKGRHQGRRCFILGNGPSLRQEDLTLLEGELSIIVNRGHEFARARGLVPTYHACVDEVFSTGSWDALLADWLDFQQETGATFLCSQTISERLDRLGLQIDRYEFHQFLTSKYTDGCTSLPDLTCVQPGFLSVVHFAVTVAIYMGAREICLLGCDMDFFVEPHKPLAHSYDEGDIGDIPTSAESFGWDQVELMEWALNEFSAFKELGIVARQNGCTIINCGRGGVLNVFPREQLESVCSRPVR